jgi:putative addiction module component (TIGR02574 family)
MSTTKNILEQAMKLKPVDRYFIIEGLLKSLDEPNKTIDEIWALEAEKRLQAFKEGRLKTLTYNEVFEN